MQNLNFFKYCLLVFVSSILVFSCGEEDSVTQETTESSINVIYPETGPDIITSLYGRIVDNQNQIIESASVTCHTCVTESIVETDENGYFLFDKVQHQGNSAYLSVSYPGTFKAFRRLGVIPERLNYTEIQLNEKVRIGSLTAEMGGLLTHNSGASVDLPSDGIMDKDGNSYTGEYEVFMSWIRPDADNLIQNMVGDFSGIDIENNEVALTTFGMLVVELLDAQGNELNLKDGNNATLSFPVPSSLIDKAPATIPLWYYNEENGYWLEESTATLEGEFYVGKVAHFSSWNCDTYGPSINVSGTVNIRDSGLDYAASYYQIFVCSPSIGEKGGWLCDDGSFLFFNFPANEAYIIKVVDCDGNIVFENDYGPSTQDATLNITIDGSGNNNILISGNAIDCNMNPIENGFVRLKFGERNYVFPVSAGNFSFSVVDCAGSTDGTLTIIDDDFSYSSDLITISPNNQNIQLPDVEVCEEVASFMHIILENEFDQFYEDTVVSTDPNGFVFQPGEHITLYEDGDTCYIELQINSTFRAKLSFLKPVTLNQIVNGQNADNAFTYFKTLSGGKGNLDNVEFVFSEFDLAAGLAIGEFSGEILSPSISVPTPDVNGFWCWDTNQDGVNDASEDVNGDGNFNSFDCTLNIEGSFKTE